MKNDIMIKSYNKMPQVTEELWNAQAGVTNKYFPELMIRVHELVPGKDFADLKDIYEKYRAIIFVLAQGNSAQRLTSRCLSYIRTHCNMLRHGQGMDQKNRDFKQFQIAITTFEDLEVALTEMGHLSLCDLVKEFSTAYKSYFAVKKINIGLYKKLVSSSVILEPSNPDEPPKYQPIDWYKENGWSPFLMRKEMWFVSGNHQYEKFTVVRINGNNIKCLFANGVSHCVSSKNLVSWE